MKTAVERASAVLSVVLDLHGRGPGSHDKAIAAIAQAITEGERERFLELLDKHFWNIDGCVADATRFGSGGASMVGSSVKSELDKLRATLRQPTEKP